ncbi:hypothetical protein PSTG_18939 [Puccinia striiformis f. sp. tritici PST-78]|uniref:Uncharacterized protein n=1 Tax=Puccinia striiformis f. sp. tritici PST-78 TaxID=1165861 RepID=A0A0L0UL42_9BASI|nr:hypothetical protein PSTG_18939 [Puccinia striiformis f. sp. tritici PST-78]
MVDAINQSDDKQEAENALHVKTRMQHALNAMVQAALKGGDKNILAVSSGLSMQMMISDMTDNPEKNKPLANAAVVKITYKDGEYKCRAEIDAARPGISMPNSGDDNNESFRFMSG